MKRTLLALATTLAVLASADIAAKDATAEAAYASGDVTLNRAWIPPLYLTWD